MIDIIYKQDCVGCNACVQRCPKQCISMHEDDQGFLYPKVDLSLCIHCDLCEKVCPVINQSEPRKPLETYAAKNPDDEVRMSSSSGGIFFALAKTIIDEGGVVFGAKFDENWEVVHGYAETLEEIRAFQGSKYVQSRIGETFIQVERFLKAGRKVMFTGTPCQIAALGLFLRKDYGDRLLKVDVVCHGVPSPSVWRDYLRYITRPKAASDGKNTDSQSTLKDIKIRDISRISFRDKRINWEKYGFAVHTVARKDYKNTDLQSIKDIEEDQELLYETLDKNIFMQGFLKNLYLRPSCYDCPTKRLKSGSDIVLADFWGIYGIDSEAYDNTGVSLILANTPKGIRIFKNTIKCYRKESFEKASASNPAIISSCHYPKYYTEFWHDFALNGIYAIMPIIDKMRPSFVQIIAKRLISKVTHIIKRK